MMSKREIIRIIELFDYQSTHINEWIHKPVVVGGRSASSIHACISFYKEKKNNFIKFNYGKAIPLSEFTIDVLFEYMLRKDPELKDKVRDYKLSKILDS